MKELEDKLAHQVKPSAQNIGDSKQEDIETAPYWFEDGKNYSL